MRPKSYALRPVALPGAVGRTPAVLLCPAAEHGHFWGPRSTRRRWFASLTRLLARHVTSAGASRELSRGPTTPRRRPHGLHAQGEPRIQITSSWHACRAAPRRPRGPSRRHEPPVTHSAPEPTRARFAGDGARKDAQYMSLDGATFRTQRTAKPLSAKTAASLAAGDGRSLD